MRTSKGVVSTIYALALATGLGAMMPGTASAQKDREVARLGVVKITCKFADGGKMVSSGFVWLDSRHVVTALHGVAGCKQRMVRSEGAKKESKAGIVTVNLEADLALLKLERDLGLRPIEHVTSPPNTRDEFYTWGYPHAVNEMIDTHTRIGGGQRGGKTTLGSAFRGVDQLNELFEGQDYPTKNTAILRLTTTVQPGQSGAPILDRNGRVVGIVDGGLLGGWKGINWSISALDYLPSLPSSGDKAPTQRSKWAALYSKVTTDETKTVAYPAEAGGSATKTGEFVLVRRLFLSDLEKYLAAGEQDFSSEIHLNNITFIRDILEDPAEFDRLTFDIYQDAATGATVGVPSGFDLAWNERTKALEPSTRGGKVRLFINVTRYTSFQDATIDGKRAFVGNLAGLAEWESSPFDIDYGDYFESEEWAEPFSQFFPGTDARSGDLMELKMSVGASGNVFLGYAAYGPAEIETLPNQDLAAWLMMQMSVDYLLAFAQR